jgi:hypothetical protein
LQEPGNHEGQEEANVLRISFQRGQLALLLVQAPPQRSPDALKLGVGEPGQRQEVGRPLTAYAKGRQDSFDVGGGR